MRSKRLALVAAMFLAALASPASAAYDILYTLTRNSAEIIPGARYTTLGEAVTAAAGAGWGTVVLPRGTHEIGAASTASGDGFNLVLQNDTILTPADSGGIGIITVAGDNCRLTGGTILIDAAVDDQKMVYVTGHRFTVDDVRFRATTLDATTSNPMICVDLYQSQASRVDRCTFALKRGISGVRGTEGMWNEYTNNRFVPDELAIFEASETTVTSDPMTTPYLGEMYRGIDLQHDGWAKVTNNTARMLGRPNATLATGAAPLNYSLQAVAAAGTYTITAGTLAVWGINPAANEEITITGFTNGGNNGTKLIASVTSNSFTVVDNSGMVDETKNATGSEPTLTMVGHEVDSWLHMKHEVDADTNEAGHPLVVGNYVEDVIAPCYVRCLGVRWGQIVGNTFANSLSGIRTVTEAAIIFDSEDQDGSSQPSDDILVSGNQFHNIPFASAASLGGDIRLAYCNRISIIGNHFSNNLGQHSITIDDGDTALDFNILSNVFEGRSYAGAGNTPLTPIHFIGGSTVAKYVIGGNVVEGYSGGLITKDNAVTGEVFETGLMDISDGGVPDGGTTTANLTTNIRKP